MHCIRFRKQPPKCQAPEVTLLWWLVGNFHLLQWTPLPLSIATLWRLHCDSSGIVPLRTLITRVWDPCWNLQVTTTLAKIERFTWRLQSSAALWSKNRWNLARLNWLLSKGLLKSFLAISLSLRRLHWSNFSCFSQEAAIASKIVQIVSKIKTEDFKFNRRWKPLDWQVKRVYVW